MSEIDDELQRRLKSFAEEVSPQAGRGGEVVRAARTKRRIAAVGAGVMAIVLVAGVAGAANLLGDMSGVDPAPQPEETSGCVSVGYDLAVGVPETASDDEVTAIEQRLSEDERVVKVWFVSKEDATRTYLAENPNHEGRAPSAHAVDQFRLDLVTGVDPHDQRLMREFAEIGAGAYAPALRCPPEQPRQNFARYFFEVDEGNTSASGTLEVDAQHRSICLEVQTRNIKASHLLLLEDGSDVPEDVDGAARSPSIVFTFFEPNSDNVGADLPATGTHCFSGEQLGELDDQLLADLVESPQRFRIDFHRGPNDEPGLVAELVPQEPDRCASGPLINKVTSRAHPGQRVAFVGECFLNLNQRAAKRLFLTRMIELPSGEAEDKEPRTCRFVAKAASSRHVLDDGKLRGWLTVPAIGECRTPQSLRTDVPLRPGTYDLAIGCASCTYASVRITAAPAPSRFDSPQEAIDYIAARLDVPVDLPRDLPPDTRLDPRSAVTVDDGGAVVAATLKLRFGEKGILGFDFGRTMFDGCGGDGAVEVDIGGTPGLMLAKDRYPWTQIIWPAQPGDRSATYGIYGSLHGDEMLKLARSMDLGLQGEGKPAGC